LVGKGKIIQPLIEELYETIEQMLNETRKFIASQPFDHYIRQGSVQGCFKIAKALSFSSLSKSNCSFATDSNYLYVLH
jgi:hypothetical protein